MGASRRSLTQSEAARHRRFQPRPQRGDGASDQHLRQGPSPSTRATIKFGPLLGHSSQDRGLHRPLLHYH